MSNWWNRLTQAIYREYDRRIRRASQVTEYGAAREPHAEHTPPAPMPEDEDEGVVIANVPRGTEVRE